MLIYSEGKYLSEQMSYVIAPLLTGENLDLTPCCVASSVSQLSNYSHIHHRWKETNRHDEKIMNCFPATGSGLLRLTLSNFSFARMK